MLILVGGYMSAIVFISAEPLILKAFGRHFLPIVPIVRILSLSIVLMYLYTPYSQAMIIFQKQRTLFACQAIAAAVSVLGNLATIPRFGMYGAAWTAVATHGSLLALLSHFAPKCTPTPFMGREFGRVLFGCGICSLLVLVTVFMRASPWFGIALATCLFGGLGITVNRRSGLVLSVLKWGL